MQNLKNYIIFFLLLSFLTNCSLKPVKTAAINTYELDSVPQHLVHAKKTNKTILVTALTSSPIYQSSNMLYVNKQHEVQSFTKNAWIASPAEMLTPLLIQTLRNTGHFHAVVTLPFTGLSDYRLNVQLLLLQQEFLSQPSKVHMTLQADLISSTSNKVIASQRFETVVPAVQDNPYAGVIAANQATQQLLREIAVFVVRTI